MKSLPIFVLIIVSLMAFVPFIEGKLLNDYCSNYLNIIMYWLSANNITAGHTVYIQNKLVAGTSGIVAGTIDKEDNFNWQINDSWAQDSSRAHAGFSLSVPDNLNTYWLVFAVGLSTEQYKWRGPFTNNQDICWHFHGHIDSWDVYPCPQ